MIGGERRWDVAGHAPAASIASEDTALPIEGKTAVNLPVGELWRLFADVPRWPEWIPCMFWARVTGGELRVGARLVWAFNAIKPAYLYKLPAMARIVACEPERRVTWEVTLPGFHALHSYTFESTGAESSAFGSWEVAEGPAYKLLRPFWLAHFRYVRDESLRAAAKLRRSGQNGA